MTHCGLFAKTIGQMTLNLTSVYARKYALKNACMYKNVPIDSMMMNEWMKNLYKLLSWKTDPKALYTIWNAYWRWIYNNIILKVDKVILLMTDNHNMNTVKLLNLAAL